MEAHLSSIGWKLKWNDVSCANYTMCCEECVRTICIGVSVFLVRTCSVMWIGSALSYELKTDVLLIDFANSVFVSRECI